MSESRLLYSIFGVHGRPEGNNRPRPKDSDRLDAAYDLLFSGKFEQILNEFKLELSNCNDLNGVEEFVKIYSTINNELLMINGIAALQLFVQCNFSGPLVVVDFIKFDTSHVLNALAANEDFYKFTKSPDLFWFAKIAFEALLLGDNSEGFGLKWWYFRLLRVTQCVVEEPSATVYYQMVKLIEESLENAHFDSPELMNLLHVEAAISLLQFGDVSRSKKLIESAMAHSGLVVEMSGALGVRTKFQQTAYSQLVLKVKSDRKENQIGPNLKDLPRDVKLDNETLLPKISFLNLESDDKMSPSEQCLVLALCMNKLRSGAQDDMLKEEVIAFAEAILRHPQVWCLQFSALFVRSKQEKNSMKKLERAMMQVQALVDLVNNPSDETATRLDLFYCSNVPTFWYLEKELAHLLVALGAIKSALDVFLRLQLWEQVVFCYKQLNRNNKAEEVIREQLLVAETPTLLCLLGDVTNDPQHYHKAWELSKCRSARAQRSLGYFHFQKKQYPECIPYFSKAVEISSLDQSTWFMLAHAATQTEDYELATKCYHRVINLDPDSFEAWNNLSNAYIKTKQKLRAFKSLQEAIKCSFDNWKIWENFLLVCVDVGAFEEAIQAWHRLIDIKGKHLDEQVLGILIGAIVSNIPDSNSHPAGLLTPKALKLMGHITATVTTSARAWNLYGKLQSTVPDMPVESLEKVVQYHQKAYRCATQKTGWEKSADNCLDVLNYVRCLSMANADCIAKLNDVGRIAALKQSNKLVLKSVWAVVNRQLNEGAYSDEAEIRDQFNWVVEKLKEE